MAWTAAPASPYMPAGNQTLAASASRRVPKPAEYVARPAASEPATRGISVAIPVHELMAKSVAADVTTPCARQMLGPTTPGTAKYVPIAVPAEHAGTSWSQRL